MRKSFEERFREKEGVQDESGCRNWTGTKHGRGYGCIGRNYKTILAHRAAWELTFGTIPTGLLVCHHCDNKLCTNPQHLFLGTHADNNRDCIRKGRNATGDRNGLRKHPERNPALLYPERLARGEKSGARLHPESRPRGDQNGARLHPERLARGERQGSAKLTASQVVAIRERWLKGASQAQLAREFPVKKSQVQNIVHGKSWQHLLELTA